VRLVAEAYMCRGWNHEGSEPALEEVRSSAAKGRELSGLPDVQKGRALPWLCSAGRCFFDLFTTRFWRIPWKRWKPT
jgi:hypothetical protein